MNKRSKIYVAGHTGLVGSAIVNNLLKKGYTNLILKKHTELDLTQQNLVKEFFMKEEPEYVVLAAAKVGGILANNNFRGDFIYENMMIQNNVIHQSYVSGIKKLLFLGSSCIYPQDSPQPISEDSLLTSNLQYTNEPYAIAKIAGIKMCESYNLQYGTNFISVMPSNLYGPNDNFDLGTSHVIPALIRKIYLAHCIDNLDWEAIRKDLHQNPIQGIDQNKSNEEIILSLAKYGIKKSEVEIWGSGAPRREFLYSEDMADACVFLLEHKDFNDIINPKDQEIRNTHINIGTGVDISIKDLAEKIKNCVGYRGDFKFNTSKPDGTLNKLMDINKVHKLGWSHSITLQKGVEKLFAWYLLQ